MVWAVCAVVLLCTMSATASSPGPEGDREKEYTNMWIAEIHGGEHVARRVARDLGYNYGGQADVFEDHYVLTRDDHPEVSKRSSIHLTRSLQDVDEVKWAEQQAVVVRSKRGFIPRPPEEEEDEQQSEPRTSRHQDLMKLLNSIYGGKLGNTKPNTAAHSKTSTNSKPHSTKTTGSKLGTFSTKPSSTSLNTYKGVTKHVECLSSKTSAYQSMFNDPLWPNEWYIQDYRTQDMPVMDLNVVPVYKMGITGKSVTIAVVDDGVEHGHPDMIGNFVESLSYDMGSDKPGSTPDPSTSHPNSHGTKCAGEIAMVANNNKCGVGIAYNSKIAGIKVLGKRSVDYVEAKGLIYRLDKFDIYSNSWGPSDDAMTMEKVGRMSALSFEKGSTQGRQGKGAIYVFAGGNGRHLTDNCACDGLVNNVYTIAIASVSQRGKIVYYSESCTAIFAAAYSGGNSYDEKVATIDLNGKCTTSFSGTSAAAPLATGIIALALDANPKLTYRDVMHLITMSAEVAPLADNGDIWYKNGRGFWVSNDFGFGLLNGENMVNLAKTWKNVPKKNTCIVSVKLDNPQYITVGETANIEFQTVACQDTKNDAVHYLEQVEVTSTVQYPYRGALSMTLKSPAGTKSTLLQTRPKDSNKDGLKEWTIKTLHNWGENPKGKWEIEVKANALTGVRAASGYVLEFTISFHGTKDMPAHYSQRRKYSGFRLSNGKTSELLLRMILQYVLEMLGHFI
ncbi:neuroendocrine convertase 1-like isoform X1 [Homalodisca vitripennis]|uniref:neuroendocrine convertase 1-like isoform X1 n=1 Tax=Homalodisca vitripennis TaxID=197043 RepID=UPI001EE9D3BF|nr:neuroendocrine convertase 1-like isoform X1 [Homalodisca vitripennis]